LLSADARPPNGSGGALVASWPGNTVGSVFGESARSGRPSDIVTELGGGIGRSLSGIGGTAAICVWGDNPDTIGGELLGEPARDGTPNPEPAPPDREPGGPNTELCGPNTELCGPNSAPGGPNIELSSPSPPELSDVGTGELVVGALGEALNGGGLLGGWGRGPNGGGLLGDEPNDGGPLCEGAFEPNGGGLLGEWDRGPNVGGPPCEDVFDEPNGGGFCESAFDEPNGGGPLCEGAFEPNGGGPLCAGEFDPPTCGGLLCEGAFDEPNGGGPLCEGEFDPPK
jgi:hypothetical protein